MARRLRLPIGFMFDIAVIGIALGEAIGRIGDVINGEHHAVACTGLPWCVRYTHVATLGQTEYVHPVAVYDVRVNGLTYESALWNWWSGAQPQVAIHAFSGAGPAADCPK